MPNKRKNGPLGLFLRELKQQKIDLILMGAMAAVRQGAPLTTIDYDLWLLLPKRQAVRVYSIIQNQGGTVLAPTFFELTDGTQVNVIFEPSGLQSFATEAKRCSITRLDGVGIKMLPLTRIIKSKKSAGRDKDLLAIPILEKTIRLKKRNQKK